MAVVVHADAAVGRVGAEHRRVVVAVDADLGVAARELVERVGVARETVGVRAVHGGGVGRLQEDAQVVLTGGRRRGLARVGQRWVGGADRHRPRVDDLRGVGHRDGVRAEGDVDVVRVRA